jgi:hypothetical protein
MFQTTNEIGVAGELSACRELQLRLREGAQLAHQFQLPAQRFRSFGLGQHALDGFPFGHDLPLAADRLLIKACGLTTAGEHQQQGESDQARKHGGRYGPDRVREATLNRLREGHRLCDAWR